MNRRDVQEIVEHRHPTERRDPLANLSARAIEERQQKNSRPQRHQQELKRRRILGSVDVTEKGREPSWRSHVPVTRIAVHVDSAQQEEENNRRHSNCDAGVVAASGLHCNHCAKGVACRHYSDPRNDRVQHCQHRSV